MATLFDSVSDNDSHPIITHQEEFERQMKFIGRCRSNFVFAAKVLLDIELATPQKAMIHAMRFCAFVMVVASRGLGKSFCMAIYAVLKCMLFPEEKVGIISYSYRQAKFVFGYIAKLYSKSPYLRASCVGPPTMGADSCHLRFKNGSFIMALPLGDGEKIRGARFYTLLVDEAVKLPEEVFEVAVLPMLNVAKDPMEQVKKEERRAAAEAAGIPFDEPEAKNQIVMCTTAWFQFSYLYKKLVEWKKFQKEGDPDYNVLEFTYMDVPKGFFVGNMIEHSRKTMSPLRFAMENMAYWPPDSDGFFNRSIFEGARGRHSIQMSGEKGKKYVISIDPAREKDNISIHVAEVGVLADLAIYPHKLIYTESISPTTINSNADPNGNKYITYRVRQVYEAFNTEGEVISIGLDQGGGGSALRDSLADDKYEIPNSYEFGEDAGKIIKAPRLLQIKGQNPQHDRIHENACKVIDLISFSTEWLNPAAWHLIDQLKSRNLLIPNYKRDGDDEKLIKEEKVQQDKVSGEGIFELIELGNVPVDVRDEIMEEIEKMIEECTAITATELPSKKGMLKFDTNHPKGAKDRWASLMILSEKLYTITQSGIVPAGQINTEGIATPIIENSNSIKTYTGNIFSKELRRELITANNGDYDGFDDSNFDPMEDVRYSDEAALG